jgi:hypothetical protein
LAAAAARAGTIVLLLPTATGTPPPPLSGTGAFGGVQENVVPGEVRNRELVEVGLARDGSPTGVVVTQRLVLSRPGDFSFTVPAPATDVVPAPGSQAEPGLRRLGIVWQGFSSGRRVLAARVTLAPGAAAAGLPLRISVRRAGDRVIVVLADAATRTVLLATGTTSQAALGGVVARLRAALKSSPDRVTTAGVFALIGTPTGQVRALVAAPLRVRGALTVPGRRPVPVSAELGHGHPLTQTIALPGRSLPTLALRVELLDPLELLPTPQQLAGARDRVSSLQHALGAMALSWQYRHFLASPDPLGPTRTAYVYRTLAQTPVATALPGGSSDDDTIAIVLAATLGAAALVGAVILWAHL